MQNSVAIFDIEANGFLESVTDIHSLVIDLDGHTHSFAKEDVRQGVELLLNTETLVGHNIICYDLPALTKVFGVKFDNKVFDTMNVSRLIYTNLLDIDFKTKKCPKRLYGKHRLEAWGHRLGEHKGDYKGPWDKWSDTMQEYCEQDVKVTKALYNLLKSKNYSERAIEIEHEFQKIIHRQEVNGILFDTETATQYAARVGADIKERKDTLRRLMPVKIKRQGSLTPKRDHRGLGYKQGCPLSKISITDPNPGSREQVVNYFKEKGWEPAIFTDVGNPKLDDEILRELPYEGASEFADLFERIKVQGYLETGKNSWLKLAKNGRIYGRVITNGAVTGRCTHHTPNLAQIPAVRSYMGKECRSLFHSGLGYMVGADASGLELRMLAHYLSPYDEGKYAKEIITGDIHTANQRAANLETRDQAKTFIYAFCYGAGNAKLGSIVTGSHDDEYNKSVGTELRESFLSKVKGLRQLTSLVKGAAQKGYLKGLDGRHLHIRSDHKALNTLLQGAGAVIMKQANINFWQDCQYECQQVLNVHDEWEVVTNIHKETGNIGELMVSSIKKAGKDFNLRIELDGEYKIGRNWAEVH